MYKKALFLPLSNNRLAVTYFFEAKRINFIQNLCFPLEINVTYQICTRKISLHQWQNRILATAKSICVDIVEFWKTLLHSTAVWNPFIIASSRANLVNYVYFNRKTKILYEIDAVGLEKLCYCQSVLRKRWEWCFLMEIDRFKLNFD